MNAADPSQSLNPRQLDAVRHGDGPLLVLAGAGTGKTSTLTARLASLLRSGRVRPWELLAVTFTNKAAADMRDRVRRQLDEGTEMPRWIGTFHALSAGMLRRHAELAGLSAGYSILDAEDSAKLAGELAAEMNIDPKRWSKNHLAAVFSGWKDRALPPGREPAEEARRIGGGKGAELYRVYCERLREFDAADFGDLILHMVRILQEHDEVADQYRRRFRQILVDEYQDTNVAQYMWLRLLAGEHSSVCCVGDDDQSIYGWRGARVDHILRFEKDFPGARVIRLEENYRSTGHILGVGSKLVSRNASRLGKTLWTAAGNGEKVRLGRFADGRGEAAWIAGEVDRLTSGRGSTRPSGVGVLVRAIYLMRVLEEQFRWNGIPYEIVGGPGFFRRTEVRDAIAYLQVIRNPAAMLAFTRIANTPRRGLGAETMRRVREAFRERETVADAARAAIDGGLVKGRGAKSLASLLEQFESWREAAATAPPRELASRVLGESGYIEMWKGSIGPDAPARLENLREFVSAVGERSSIDEFLGEAEIQAAEGAGDETERVRIMTIHAAKGLEFDAVFLPGWEDQVIPSPLALEEDEARNLEEERRLAHVAVTRARSYLSISHAAMRFHHGKTSYRDPSRFLKEIPREHVLAVGGVDGLPPPHPEGSNLELRAARSRPYSSPGWRRLQRQAPLATSGVARRPLAGRLVTLEDGDRFKPGSRVSHPRFGDGSVLACDGLRIEVDFSSGRKTVLASYLDPADG